MRSTLKGALIAVLGIGAGLAARALRRILVQEGQDERKRLAVPPDEGAAASRRPGAAAGRTRAELYEEAKRRGIKGRSQMTKAQLEEALAKEG